MSETAAAFVFLRPLWLYALLALPLLLWALRHRRRDGGAWQRAVDPHLLPHLLHAVGGRESRGAGVLLVLGYALGVLALAGPSWRQEATPLFQVQAPLVIALDLSSAMRAADLPPSRLTQARAKIAALLDARRGGQVGLLAYANDAFTVAPITRDARTVKALLDSLYPDIMPADGQRADRAITHAVELMRGAKFDRGEVLVVTDQADRVARSAAADARAAGFRVSVLGVGTSAGAPVSGPSGFETGPDGKVRLARLDAASLRQLASSGGGGYAALTHDLADLTSLGVLDPQGRAESPEDAARLTADAGAAREGGVRRMDQGYWLLLALLPVVLLGFRRSWLVMLPLAVSLGVLAPTVPSYAQDAGTTREPAAETEGFSWASLWKRADQRAREALEQGEAEAARALAKDPALAASAAYRGDDYEAAAETWDALDDADAKYNRGNALAKSGKLEDALTAYDEALEREPGMPDAVANRKIVEDALKQQQQQQQQQGDKQEQGDQGKDQQQGDQQQQDQQQGDQQDGEQKDGQQPQDGENKDGQQKEGEQQDGEPKQGEEQGKEPKPGEEEGKDESDSGKSPQGDEPSDQEQANDKPGQGDKESQPEPKDPKLDPEAQAAQQRADEEAKREMQQALEAAQQEGEGKDADKQGAAKAPLTAEQRAEEEQRQALERWLRRVPDDPGALLRRKFALEHQRRQAEGRDP